MIKNTKIILLYLGTFLILPLFSTAMAQESSVEMEPVSAMEKAAPPFTVKSRKKNQNSISGEFTYHYSPAFTAQSHKGKAEGLECASCHQSIPANSEIRNMPNSHINVTLKHGGERFWCLTCHSDDRNYLRSLNNKKIDFDRSYRLCAQCHFRQQQDWFFGAHGKRIGNWRGERVLFSCTECHNPHNPAIAPSPPNPPPKVRAGLDWIPSKHHKQAQIWETGAASTPTHQVQGQTHE